MELDDRVSFLSLKPVVTRNPSVVLVDFAITLLPVEVFAGADPDPANDLAGWDFGFLFPGSDIVDDGIADVVGNPLSIQSSPSSFFSLTCSSRSSATTSFF